MDIHRTDYEGVSDPAEFLSLIHICILVRVTDEDSAVLALIENLQRCDLHYLEEAQAISKLIAQYGLSQEEAARRLGRSQSAVANKLRLLRLSDKCAALLRQYNLTERHARAVLRLEGEDRQLSALQKMGEEQMNVAAAEAYVEELLHQVQRQKMCIRDRSKSVSPIWPSSCRRRGDWEARMIRGIGDSSLWKRISMKREGAIPGKAAGRKVGVTDL